MAKYSSILRKLADEDERVDSYEFDPDNDQGCHWLHLANGWINAESGTHSIHENSVSDTRLVLRQAVVPCMGKCCESQAAGDKDVITRMTCEDCDNTATRFNLLGLSVHLCEACYAKEIKTATDFCDRVLGPAMRDPANMPDDEETP